MFQRIKDEHGRDGEKSEKRQAIHWQNSLGDGTSATPFIARVVEPVFAIPP
jgi:hypothetical protein